LTVLSINRIYI